MLIKSHKNVLESKKTDSVSVLAKKAAWSEVTEQFNAVSGGSKRDCKQLQCWWDNQKKRAHRNFSDNRVKTFATGFVRRKSCKYTVFSWNIVNIVSSNSVWLNHHVNIQHSND